MCKALYAVILNWNNYADTRECIESLQKSSYRPVQIILVDNASSDGSIERLQRDYAQDMNVHIIRNPVNYGFARGVNIGIRYALEHGAELVFLVNNDAVVDLACIENLYKILINVPKAGIAGPRIFYYKDPEKIWAGGGFFNWLKTSVAISEKNKFVHEVTEETKQVTFLTGCAMLIKREVIERIGLFDEDYFLYGEDVDFCLRALKAGFKLLYVPTAKVWHKIEYAARNRVSPSVLYHMARSRILRVRKNFSWPYLLYGLLLHFLLFTPYHSLQALRRSRSLHGAISWLRGTWAGLIYNMGPHRILIKGYYGKGNLGDETILMGLTKTLSSHVGKGWQIKVVASGPFPMVGLSTGTTISKLRAFLDLPRTSWLIIGGGGLLPGSFKALIYHFTLAVVAKVFGARVSLLCIGVDPVKRVKKFLVRLLCLIADDIVVRDRGSLSTLELLVPNKEIILACDAMFLIDLEAFDSPEVANEPYILVSLNGKITNDVEQWVKALDACVEFYKMKVKFSVMFKGENDKKIMKKIQTKMQYSSKTELVTPTNLEEVMKIINGGSLVISNRLHVILLASRMGIPALVIVKKPKLSYFAQELGCEAINNPKGISSALGKLIQKISSREFRSNINARVSELETRASILHDVISNAIKEMEIKQFRVIG